MHSSLSSFFQYTARSLKLAGLWQQCNLPNRNYFSFLFSPSGKMKLKLSSGVRKIVPELHYMNNLLRPFLHAKSDKKYNGVFQVRCRFFLKVTYTLTKHYLFLSIACVCLTHVPLQIIEQLSHTSLSICLSVQRTNLSICPNKYLNLFSMRALLQK